MDNPLRYRSGYRALYARWLPLFMLNEIGPAIECISDKALKDDNLTVFDVGANTGVWSAALLTHSGKFIDKLHMFEPMSGNLERFDTHKKLGLFDPMSDKLKMNNCAVSDTGASLSINYDTEETAFASASVAETLIGNRKILLSNTLTVPSVTVDGYSKSQKIDRIHLMKIDVEGHEMAVLKGAEKMLNRKAIDVVVYEFGTHQIARREYFKDFFELFSDYGYTNYRARPNGWPPVSIPKYSTNEENFSQVRTLLAVANPV